MFKKVMSMIMALTMVFSVLAVTSSAVTKTPELKFDENGRFRIVHITDTHFTDFPFEESIAFISRVLDDYSPDLVVLGGDNIKGWFDTSMQLGVKAAIDQLVAPMEERSIPFTYVYGNHDWEAYLCPKSLQNKYYSAHENCISPDGYNSVTRTGNGNVLIKNSDGTKSIFNIWLLDSGTNSKPGSSTVDAVNTSQIKWYTKTSNSLKEGNGGNSIPSIVFQHFPVNEVTKLFDESESGVACEGKKYALKSGLTGSLRAGKPSVESNGLSTHLNKSVEVPTENMGEYSAFAEQGDVVGIFFGHSHVNDYCGVTDDGIILGATLSAGGFNISSRFDDADGNQVEARGVRIIDIDERALEDPTLADTEAVSTFSVCYSDYFSGSIERYPKKYKERDKHDFGEWIQIELQYFFEFVKTFFSFSF